MGAQQIGFSVEAKAGSDDVWMKKYMLEPIEVTEEIADVYGLRKKQRW